jgi:hypothetical protein
MKKRELKGNAFGKKSDAQFKILERKYKDGHTSFYVEIQNNFDIVNTFGLDWKAEPYIYDETFDTFEAAKKCVDELKEEDLKLTLVEEIVHKVE